MPMGSLTWVHRMQCSGRISSAAQNALNSDVEWKEAKETGPKQMHWWDQRSGDNERVGNDTEDDTEVASGGTGSVHWWRDTSHLCPPPRRHLCASLVGALSAGGGLRADALHPPQHFLWCACRSATLRESLCQNCRRLSLSRCSSSLSTTPQPLLAHWLPLRPTPLLPATTTSFR